MIIRQQFGQCWVRQKCEYLHRVLLDEHRLLATSWEPTECRTSGLRSCEWIPCSEGRSEESRFFALYIFTMLNHICSTIQETIVAPAQRLTSSLAFSFVAIEFKTPWVLLVHLLSSSPSIAVSSSSPFCNCYRDFWLSTSLSSPLNLKISL